MKAYTDIELMEVNTHLHRAQQAAMRLGMDSVELKILAARSPINRELTLRREQRRINNLGHSFVRAHNARMKIS